MLNKLHPVYLLKALLDEKKLTARGKKSAVIITSSGLSLITLPGMAPYCATKRAVSFLAQSLNVEFADSNSNIDILGWDAGAIKSNLNRVGKNGPQKYVQAIFNRLGKTSRSNGHIDHDWMHSLI